MALSFSAVQVLNVSEVSLSAAKSAEARRRDHVALSSSPRMSSLRIQSDPMALQPLIERRLPRDVRDSRRIGVRCGVGMLATDLNSTGNVHRGQSEHVGNNRSLKVQQQATLQHIRSARVIACLRTGSSKLALDAARAALDAGLTVLEIIMTTPSAVQVIEVLVREYPMATIGAGTVLSTHDADAAINAGAKFLASPVIVEEMVRAHKDGPVVIIPGAMTPTEVATAYELGAPAVKLYPVTLLGGVPYVCAVSKPMAHIPLIVSQGCTLDMVDPFIAAGSTAVIVSDGIFDKSALGSKDFNKIRHLARVALSKGRPSQLNVFRDGGDSTRAHLKKLQ